MATDFATSAKQQEMISVLESLNLSTDTVEDELQDISESVDGVEGLISSANDALSDVTDGIGDPSDQVPAGPFDPASLISLTRFSVITHAEVLDAIGAQADAAAVGDVAGTAVSHLRGISSQAEDVKTLLTAIETLLTSIELLKTEGIPIKDGATANLGEVGDDGFGNATVIMARTLPRPEGAASEATLIELNGKLPAPVDDHVPVNVESDYLVDSILPVDGKVSLVGGKKSDDSITPLKFNSLGRLETDGSATTQPIEPVAGSIMAVRPPFTSRVDVFTATGNGTAVIMTLNPCRDYAIQVKGTGGAPTTWDVRLEGSLDGVNFSQIIAHTNVSGDGVVAFSIDPAPCLYFRSRCAGLVLGGASNIYVTILGMH